MTECFQFNQEGVDRFVFHAFIFVWIMDFNHIFINQHEIIFCMLWLWFKLVLPKVIHIIYSSLISSRDKVTVSFDLDRLRFSQKSSATSG